jgi:hypothetical protein
MGAFSDYLELKILEHVVGKTSYTMPTAYVALVMNASPPNDSLTGSTITEPSGGSYARVATSAGTWGSASAGSITNSGGSITFPQATGSGWGVVGYFALVDASSAGNLLAYGTLAATKTIDPGDTPSFATSSLTITLD